MSTDMRVLFLFPHMVNHGGALHYQLHAAAELAARGETVGILALRHDPARITVPAGIEVLTTDDGPLTSDLRYWLLAPLWQRRVEALALAWGADVLIPQVFPSNWWGWRLRRRHPDKRLLWICHEPSAFIHSERWIAAIRPAWKRWAALALRPITRHIDMTGVAYSDAILGNSEASRRLGMDVYTHVDEGPAYPGVDLERFPMNPEARADLLVTSGLLSSFKRVDFLIDVVAGLRRRRPDLCLEIVGQGPDEAALKAKVKAMGLEAGVRFLGRVSEEELGATYRRGRLYVHGAIDEPFGMSMVEALRPVCT
jgi:glycosyltransferase involved in cell wall biosynthesis